MMKQRKQGFTLAELLVVVAIIGILVTISIPIFTAQRRKAIIAVNKANIRSAKAAAAAKLYESEESLSAFEGQVKDNPYYFVYNISTGAIEKVLQGNNVSFNDTIQTKNGTISGTRTVNNWGREYRKMAKNGEICPKILVYLGNPAPDSIDHAAIQTAPYYIENEIGGGDQSNSNPFGPQPGSTNVS